MGEHDTLLDRLRATRHDYEAERAWHKFLLDAYAGTGGFAGRVRLPFSGYWGMAAEVYSTGNAVLSSTLSGGAESDLDTYLERYPREEMDKFRRRVAVSQYPNYIEPIVDIRMSFMHRKPFVRSGDEVLGDWLDDVDGTGMTWDRLRREVIDFRAALLGWCPVLFDRSRPDGVEPGEVMTQAQAEQLGVRVNAIPLFPANLLDWDVDELGELNWCKVARSDVVRDDPLGDAVERTVISLWTRETVQRYRIERAGNGEPSITPGPVESHGYGRVPILVAKHKRSHEHPVRGIPMAGSASLMARKLFSYLSMGDEHIAGCVFAVLQVPVRKVPEAGEIVLGAGNALPIHDQSRRDYKYISPDPSVAETIENRVSTTVEEIYRVGRTEFARSKTATGGAESGVARAYAFENTNRAISDFATGVAQFEQHALQFVAHLLTGTPDAGESIRTTPPTKFDVEEMSRALDEALAAVTLNIGPTATLELKWRLIQRLLPNLESGVADVIREELESARAMAVAGNAFDTESSASQDDDESDDDESEEETETEDESDADDGEEEETNDG